MKLHKWGEEPKLFQCETTHMGWNCFDTDEVAGLDSTDIVDEYTTDCVVMVIKEMMEELD